MFVGLISEPLFAVNYLLRLFSPCFTKYFVAFLANVGASSFNISAFILTADGFVSSKRGKNLPNCTSLDSRLSDNFILADEPLTKAFQSLETCVSINKNSCALFILSPVSPITFDEIFKVISVSI